MTGFFHDQQPLCIRAFPVVRDLKTMGQLGKRLFLNQYCFHLERRCLADTAARDHFVKVDRLPPVYDISYFQNAVPLWTENTADFPESAVYKILPLCYAGCLSQREIQ